MLGLFQADFRFALVPYHAKLLQDCVVRQWHRTCQWTLDAITEWPTSAVVHKRWKACEGIGSCDPNGFHFFHIFRQFACWPVFNMSYGWTSFVFLLEEEVADFDSNKNQASSRLIIEMLNSWQLAANDLWRCACRRQTAPKPRYRTAKCFQVHKASSVRKNVWSPLPQWTFAKQTGKVESWLVIFWNPFLNMLHMLLELTKHLIWSEHCFCAAAASKVNWNWVTSCELCLCTWKQRTAKLFWSLWKVSPAHGSVRATDTWKTRISLLLAHQHVLWCFANVFFKTVDSVDVVSPCGPPVYLRFCVTFDVKGALAAWRHSHWCISPDRWCTGMSWQVSDCPCMLIVANTGKWKSRRSPKQRVWYSSRINDTVLQTAALLLCSHVWLKAGQAVCSHSTCIREKRFFDCPLFAPQVQLELV